MKSILMTVICVMSAITLSHAQKQEWAIALHGGAGVMSRDRISPEREAEYKKELAAALEIGKNILASGGKSVDAVEAVVVYLEDCPLFNAGKGAVMTIDKRHELDAAIMVGSDLSAGAIVGVDDIKNPIKTARMVMDKSKHVILAGKGASKFAQQNGAEIVENSYFTTTARTRAYMELFNRDKNEKFGTVGCVALDKDGNLAAATSTGGMSGKEFGRVGDVPIIGCGTYANNNTCAVSATGHGEIFIRYTVAHSISALMQYKGLSMADAAKEVIWNEVDKVPNSSGGGVICVDKDGNIALDFNTSGMHRGWANSSGESGVAVFKN